MESIQISYFHYDRKKKILTQEEGPYVPHHSEPREAALGLQVAEEVRGKVGESLCCNLQVKERADGVSRLRICWFA